MDGAQLDLADGSVDCVLSTYTLCTVPAVDAALLEIHRVLKPDGDLHFLEHGRAPRSQSVLGSAGCIRCTAGLPVAAIWTGRSMI